MSIPPTTAIDLAADDLSPCCDSALRLSSPPHGYECRECLQEFDLSPQDGDGDDTCQTVMSNGDICGREKPCQYHS